MSETWVADTWLYGVLAGDPELAASVTGVYADLAPEDAVCPYIIFTFQSGRDVSTVNGARIFTAATYLVKVITDQPSYGAVRTVAERIDALLHQAEGHTPDGTVYSCLREQPIRYTENAGGRAYRHLGGHYRLQVQASQ